MCARRDANPDQLTADILVSHLLLAGTVRHEHRRCGAHALCYLEAAAYEAALQDAAGR